MYIIFNETRQASNGKREQILAGLVANCKSKHLKGRSGPRVSGVFPSEGRSGPRVRNVFPSEVVRGPASERFFPRRSFGAPRQKGFSLGTFGTRDPV